MNSLHIDLCDLIKHNLVSVFMERFIDEIKSCKKYSKSMKEKVIKKAKEIHLMVGLGLPTTCGYNIIYNPLLYKKHVCHLSSSCLILP